MELLNRLQKYNFMINGVGIYPRQKFCNEQGCVYKMMQDSDECFERFGEVYFSYIKPDVVKGWNVHTRADMNMACINGTIELVLYDRRADSPSIGTIQEIVIGERNYCLVHIPHGIAFSWKAIDGHSALVANCATLLHDPEEFTKISIASGEIPYQWK